MQPVLADEVHLVALFNRGTRLRRWSENRRRFNGATEALREDPRCRALVSRHRRRNTDWRPPRVAKVEGLWRDEAKEVVIGRRPKVARVRLRTFSYTCQSPL